MEKYVEMTMENLKKNGFMVKYCETVEEAKNEISSMISQGQQIGIGGSVTLQQLGLQELAADKGAVVLDHNVPGLQAEEIKQIRKKQLTCDLFCCSSNAITMDGKLYNADGAGNRVAAMIFGPEKVLVAAGTNKIVTDVVAADLRVREIAAPKNNVRLNKKNPCVKAGHCMDCQSAERICNIRTIIEKNRYWRILQSCSLMKHWAINS